jgi:PAS domain S-box-containing protein
VYAPDGTFLYGNQEFLKRVGRNEETNGRKIEEISSSRFVIDMVYEKINLLKEKEMIISEDNFIVEDGNPLNYLAYWFRLPQPDGSYLIGGQAIDITEKKKSRLELERMNERFTHAVKASSDAIWDLDLLTNEIYRSDNFSIISGYHKNEIEPTLDWWYERIHPEDREKIKSNTQKFIKEGVEQWEDEYRFRYADGSWRFLVDNGFTFCKDGQPVRAIGAIQDITERKRLEEELLKEHLHKQKQISKAAIEAQDKERNILSAELHDNVNQLLMSARLHIGVAKNGGEDQENLLGKASDYLLMAAEEIRALSKQLNTSIVERAGLENCIEEIAENLFVINKIQAEAVIDSSMINRLSHDRQLMIYRIVQEQTSNIIKYAEASKAAIILEERNNQCRLSISDNGKGFDKEVQKVSGVGLINIFSRADAYNGNVKIETAPGKGCIIEVLFPFGD